MTIFQKKSGVTEEIARKLGIPVIRIELAREGHMQTPMTTKQVMTKYTDEDDVLGETCSTRCYWCGERIWFIGSWQNDDVPYEFVCPYCGQKTTEKKAKHR